MEGKAWIDRESDGFNFFHRNAEGMEGSGGGLVGNDPEIGLSGGPEAVDGDGIGDDGDELKRGA